jgi:hypothetical protein
MLQMNDYTGLTLKPRKTDRRFRQTGKRMSIQLKLSTAAEALAHGRALWNVKYEINLHPPL